MILGERHAKYMAFRRVQSAEQASLNRIQDLLLAAKESVSRSAKTRQRVEDVVRRTQFFLDEIRKELEPKRTTTEVEDVVS